MATTKKEIESLRAQMQWRLQRLSAAVNEANAIDALRQCDQMREILRDIQTEITKPLS